MDIKSEAQTVITNKQHINSFINFLSLNSSNSINTEISNFFSNQSVLGKKEIVYDRGLLLLMSNGKQHSQIAVQSENDRIVKFNGVQIEEINPYAYLKEIQMKGDGSSSRRSGRSSSSGTGSNNNNNNNNNG